MPTGSFMPSLVVDDELLRQDVEDLPVRRQRHRPGGLDARARRPRRRPRGSCTATTPWLLKPLMWLPAEPATTLRISHAGHQLGLVDRFADGLDRGVDVDHRALLQAGRRRGADAGDLDPVSGHLGHDDADLEGTDVEPHHELIPPRHLFTPPPRLFRGTGPGSGARSRTITWSSKMQLMLAHLGRPLRPQGQDRPSRSSLWLRSPHPSTIGMAGRIGSSVSPRSGSTCTSDTAPTPPASRETIRSSAERPVHGLRTEAGAAVEIGLRESPVMYGRSRPSVSPTGAKMRPFGRDVVEARPPRRRPPGSPRGDTRAPAPRHGRAARAGRAPSGPRPGAQTRLAQPRCRRPRCRRRRGCRARRRSSASGSRPW